ncbi:MAG: glutathione peroxidase [Myxococcota bacterium]|nr:glutathione peroxidase [Myxococcota bacterium]
MSYFFSLWLFACQSNVQEAVADASVASPGVSQPVLPSRLSLKSLDGSPLDSKTLEGKTVLYVNVASRCGYTSQYEQLQKVHDRYKGKGFSVVGVPCNQFGGQEPGSPQEIATFCKKNYGVDFPLLEKQDVKGSNQSGLYASLVNSSIGKQQDVRWNFEKFLVDAKGNVVKRFSSGTSPDSNQVTEAIEAALAKNP